MPWFKCLIHGKDFPGRVAGQKRPVGFYTTRVVDASCEEEAELKAVSLLKDDPSLKVPRLFRFKNKDAKVYFESIEQIPDHHQLVRQRPSGFTFYVMDN